jgi:ATPase subunit of ABC transporter with duplicated ATPase domains
LSLSSRIRFDEWSSMPTPPSSVTLVAQHISLARGTRQVLLDVSVTVAPPARLGVIGPNGVGKSTLLAGIVRIDPPRATVGLLAQEHATSSEETVRHLLVRRTGVADAEAELVEASAALGPDGKGADRYARVLERFLALSGGDIDARIEAALAELGVADVVDRPRAGLSGGEASKVALAAIVLSRFDVLLLDEPTNDLDFEGLERLADFVARHEGGVVVVSHDRHFLARTVNSVLEIDEHSHGARLFNGGWTSYQEQRATERRHAEEAYSTYDAQRRELQGRARREREWATKGVRRERKAPDNDKAQRDFRINRTEQLASRARRTERAMRRLEAVDKPWEGWDLRFRIEQAPRAGAVVARLTDAVIERGSFRLGPLDLEIGWAERVALLGPNGAGKSSLVAALLGQLPLAGGTRWLGPSVVVGELGQDRSLSNDPLAERTARRCGLTTSEARSLLAKVGIGPDQLRRPPSSLSPGERTRAELAMFQGMGVNFLVLDEPTNHLDLPAIEQLESALDGFAGTLLLVSHDRALLDAVELTRTVTLGEPS